MGDMRFIMIGIVLIFAGFTVFGVFGHDYQTANIESNEFGTCYDYSNESAPVEISCSIKTSEQTLFFALIIGIIGAGVIALIKGVKGNWDSKVNPEDIVGPGRNETDDSG